MHPICRKTSLSSKSKVFCETNCHTGQKFSMGVVCFNHNWRPHHSVCGIVFCVSNMYKGIVNWKHLRFYRSFVWKKMHPNVILIMFIGFILILLLKNNMQHDQALENHVPYHANADNTAFFSICPDNMSSLCIESLLSVRRFVQDAQLVLLSRV